MYLLHLYLLEFMIKWNLVYDQVSNGLILPLWELPPFQSSDLQPEILS